MGCIPSKNQNKSQLNTIKNSEKTGCLISDVTKTPLLSHLDDYITIQLLGTGKSSEVLLSLHRPTGEYRALKIIKKSLMCFSLTSEIEILSNLHHQKIIRCFEMLEDQSFYYISSMYCKGKNLLTKFKETNFFEEHQLVNLISQILAGISYCHEQKVIHRDLKLENILFETSGIESLIIADFGLAYQVKDCLPSDVCGTPSYMAPEIGSGTYDEKVDIWSIGIILYVLATRKFPFPRGKQKQGTRPQYTEINYNHEELNQRSPELIEFLKSLLEFDPKHRISAKNALSSDWITMNTNIEVNID